LNDHRALEAFKCRTIHPVTKDNISDDLNLQQYYYLIFDNSHSI